MQVFAICAERLRPTASSAIPSSREWDERVEAPNNGLFILIALWSAAACRRFLTSTVSASGLSYVHGLSFGAFFFPENIALLCESASHQLRIRPKASAISRTLSIAVLPPRTDQRLSLRGQSHQESR